MRIEVGTGLEGALPDVIASRIISQVIVPHFREGDFSGGINAAVTRIIAVIEGEPLPEPERRSSRQPEGSGGIGNALPILLMFVFVGSGILRAMLGRVGGAGATAGLAGVLMWILTSIMAVSIGAAVLAFLFALFTGGGLAAVVAAGAIVVVAVVAGAAASAAVVDLVAAVAVGAAVVAASAAAARRVGGERHRISPDSTDTSSCLGALCVAPSTRPR